MELDPGFSTRESRRIFGLAGRLDAMLEVESALARASAETGFIPAAAGGAIAAACERAEELDPEAIFTAGWRAGTPVIPLVTALKARLGDDHAEHVHRGATTQDIVDTAAMLQARAGLVAAGADLADAADALAGLVRRHRRTPARARTLLQPAATTTFAARAAAWLEAILADRAALRVADLRLPLQLGGPAGDLATFGDRGPKIVEGMAAHLGLTAPRHCWHADRRPVLELVAAVAGAARTAAKIAHDLVLSSQSEVGELTMRSGASSAITGKRNPIDAVRVRAAAQFALAQAAALVTAPSHEHQRAAGAWHAEWILVPLVFHGTLAALEALTEALGSVRVDTERASALADGGIDEGAATRERAIDRVLAAHRREKS